jgi:hypothetical protein
VSVEYMAGRFWKRRAWGRTAPGERTRSLRIQGITGKALIAAIALQAVVAVTGAHAQTGSPGAQPPQPPPATEPAEKTPPQAAQEAPATPAPSPPGTAPPAAPPPSAPAPQPYPYAPTYPGYPPPAYSPPPAWPAPPGGYPPPAYAPPYAPPQYPPPPYPAPAGAEQVPMLTGYGPPPFAPAPRPPVVDPQGDRVLLLPTATTHPKGTFYFSNYELVVFQGGYAFTDSTQLSVTAIPITNESVAALDFSLKSSIYRGGLVRVAAIGSASGVVGKDVGVAFLGRAGGVVQVCLARQCESSLSLSANALLVGTLLMVNGVGGIFRLSDHVSLLAELATMLPVGTQGGQFNGGLLGGGVRLHYNHWGFDFSALHALDSSDVATIPFFAMTWRP